jgi:hypothetical protein
MTRLIAAAVFLVAAMAPAFALRIEQVCCDGYPINGRVAERQDDATRALINLSRN